MVEGILVDHPEVLVHPARKILNLVTMVVELSDFTDVTQVTHLRWRRSFLQFCRRVTLVTRRRL